MGIQSAEGLQVERVMSCLSVGEISGGDECACFGCESLQKEKGASVKDDEHDTLEHGPTNSSSSPSMSPKPFNLSATISTDDISSYLSSQNPDQLLSISEHSAASFYRRQSAEKVNGNFDIDVLHIGAWTDDVDLHCPSARPQSHDTELVKDAGEPALPVPISVFEARSGCTPTAISESMSRRNPSKSSAFHDDEAGSNNRGLLDQSISASEILAMTGSLDDGLSPMVDWEGFF